MTSLLAVMRFLPRSNTRMRGFILHCCPRVQSKGVVAGVGVLSPGVSSQEMEDELWMSAHIQGGPSLLSSPSDHTPRHLRSLSPR